MLRGLYSLLQEASIMDVTSAGVKRVSSTFRNAARQGL